MLKKCLDFTTFYLRFYENQSLTQTTSERHSVCNTNPAINKLSMAKGYTVDSDFKQKYYDFIYLLCFCFLLLFFNN